MLKKLRAKFILLNMATVAVVLVIAFGAICAINAQQERQNVYDAMERALAVVEFPRASMNSGKPNDSVEGGKPTEIGGTFKDDRSPIPVAVYLVQDCQVQAISDLATAALSNDTLAEAVSQLQNVDDGEGALPTVGLLYKKQTVDGETYVAFADERFAQSWQSLALLLTGIGLATLAAFFIISLFFSRWALKPVEQAWNQQRQFVADASHELKTPLTVILANTSILMKHPESSIAAQSQWLESTQHESNRMQLLVEEMLTLAKSDAQQTKSAQADMQSVDLSAMIEKETLEFESVAFERGVMLESEVAAQLRVNGNENELRRLVSTLLDNACKYVEENGAISVVLRQTGSTARLVVENSGEGIAEEDLSHVFDRFYRADKARTSDEGGFGLGLSIAREIAERHKGTITAASDNGTTRFSVTLPLEH